MSLLIPRLEWNEQSQNADLVTATPTLSSISSTEKINVGMIAIGTGIPLDATVISKTVSSVTLNVDATSSGTFAISFVERIDFDFPPKSDSEENLKAKNTVIESISGKTQVVTNHVEATRSIDLSFISATVADKLRDNFFVFALYGNEFKWYEDKAVASYKTYELESYTFSNVREIKKHPRFLYAIRFSFRRVFI